MRVLVGCEESGRVSGAYRALGHEAWSCDLLPTRGDAAWHYQMDVIGCIRSTGKYDLIILHPDCTAMAVSGNRWYGRGMPYHQKRLDAIEWTVGLWCLACDCCEHVALENPVSVIFQHLTAPTDYWCDWPAPVQYIQPWMFGHGETKKTGLALHNLPELEPTNIVDGREQRIWKMAPGPDRKRDRSETFPGIAAAMAEQWARSIQEKTA